jgi:hypothetical protein
MNVGFLICLYGGDRSDYLEDMFNSILELNIPDGINIRIYLHIDGAISQELLNVVSMHQIYKVIESSENIGLAGGLNKLIKVLDGEKYLFRMDADDIVYKNRLVHQIQFMEENLLVDFSGGGITEFIGSPNNITCTRFYPSKEVHSVMSRSSPFAHVTVCFRHDFFEKFGLYPTNYPLNEDIAYWLQAIKIGAIGGNISDVLVNVRMDGAYGRRSIKKSLGEFKVFLKIAKWRRSGYIFPLLRFIFRLTPTPIVKFIYNSKLRTLLLNR